MTSHPTYCAGGGQAVTLSAHTFCRPIQRQHATWHGAFVARVTCPTCGRITYARGHHQRPDPTIATVMHHAPKGTP